MLRVLRVDIPAMGSEWMGGERKEGKRKERKHESLLVGARLNYSEG